LGAVYLLSEAAKSCTDTHTRGTIARAEADIECTRLSEKGKTLRAAIELEMQRELAEIHARLERDLRAIDLLERDIEHHAVGQRAWLDSIRQLNSRLADPTIPSHEIMGILEVIMTAHARLAGETRSTSALIQDHVRLILREMDDGRRRVGARAFSLPPGLN